MLVLGALMATSGPGRGAVSSWVLAWVDVGLAGDAALEAVGGDAEGLLVVP